MAPTPFKLTFGFGFSVSLVFSHRRGMRLEAAIDMGLPVRSGKGTRGRDGGESVLTDAAGLKGGLGQVKDLGSNDTRANLLL